MAMNTRTYTAGRFFMEIGDHNVGYLKSCTPPSMEGQVHVHDLGPDNIRKKQIANVGWGPGKMSVGAGMGKGMYEWIKQSFDKGYKAQSGRIVAADFDYKAQSEMTFDGAIITEVTVPKLSGDAKTALYLDVSFDPETVRNSKGDGSVVQSPIGDKQKAWLCSNYRVTIGGLECGRVASVDAFTWKCGVAKDEVGITKEPTKHATSVTVPDLKLQISMADYEMWERAAHDWFIVGKNTEPDELEGSIEFLGPDMTTVLGTITLERVGFKKFGRPGLTANEEKVARFDVELYVEKMTFDMQHNNA